MTDKTAPTAPAATTKGEQTKQAILDAALTLFRQVGYEQTTMRAVASQAGVAVGNAYYYFTNKEQLIQAFYLETQAEHTSRSAAVLADHRDFAARLAGVLHCGIDAMAPYHSFAATFFKTAAEPTSPLSPFSADSSPARAESTALFAEVLHGSTLKVDPQLREEAPELLWLAYMGVILYWVHDRSPEQHKTRALIDAAVPIIEQLLRLSRLRILRPLTRDVLALVATVKQ